MTRQPLSAADLSPNRALKDAIEKAQEKLHKAEKALAKKALAEKPTDSDRPKKIEALGCFYEVFDGGQRELLAELLADFKAPAIVVLGGEKSGKSTLLERICMMMLFSRDEQICTRMRIEVRLRRKAVASVPVLEEVDLTTNCTLSKTPFPMANGEEHVRQAMEKLVKEQNQSLSGVTSKRALVLHIHSPTVPNIDLVDLPGLVSGPRKGEPEDIAQQTESLVEQHVRKNKDQSLFMCVVPAAILRT